MDRLVSKVNRVDLVSQRRPAKTMVSRVKLVHLGALEVAKEVVGSDNRVASRNNMELQVLAKARRVDSVNKVESRSNMVHPRLNHQVRNMAPRRAMDNSKAAELLVPNMVHHHKAMDKAQVADLQVRNTELLNKEVAAVSVMTLC